MLKVISPRSGARSGSARKATTRDRQLHKDVDGLRDRVDCTQRAVARGRRTIVEAQGRVLRFVARPQAAPPHTPTAERIVDEVAELAKRLEDIQQRLLLFSSSVELEMDRLEVTCSELERVTRHRRDPRV